MGLSFTHRQGRVVVLGQRAGQAALEGEARENKEKALFYGPTRQCLKQVPSLKATRRKVKYSPFQLSRT